MEPIGWVLIAAAGLGIAPKAVREVFDFYCAKSVEHEDRKRIDKQLIENIEKSDPEYLKEEEERLKKITPKEVTEKVYFKHLQQGFEKIFTYRRINAFDQSHDDIIHGILKQVQPDGTVVAEDIYCYQPRLVTGSGAVIKPRKNADGSICAKGTYACQDAEGVFVGYSPKREIASNMIMDFDVTSQQAFVDRFPEQRHERREAVLDNLRIQKFIQVEFDRDANGNYKAVDMNNAEEKDKFITYIEKHARINSVEYYLRKIREARVELEKYLIATRPKYVPPAKPREIMKVEDKRQADQEKALQQMAEAVKINYDRARYGIVPYGSQPNIPIGPGGPLGPMGGHDHHDHHHDHGHGPGMH